MSRIPRTHFSQSRVSETGSFYSAIFIRDMSTEVMPFRDGATYPFTVSLSSKDKSLEKDLIAFLQSICMYGSAQFLDDVFHDAVEGIAQCLISDGEVYLEITSVDNKSQKGIQHKQLMFLPWDTIIHISRRYLQIVPIKGWEHGKKKYRVIPSDRIWHIKLPDILGTPREHRNTLKRLKSIPASIPNFVLDSGDFGRSVQYDSQVYRHDQIVAVEQITQKWGSILNHDLAEDATEYHDIVENLRAYYSKAVLREHIIAEMQILLIRMGIENHIRVDDLKSSADIAIAIRRLENGEIGFKEALEAVKDKQA